MRASAPRTNHAGETPVYRKNSYKNCRKPAGMLAAFLAVCMAAVLVLSAFSAPVKADDATDLITYVNNNGGTITATFTDDESGTVYDFINGSAPSDISTSSYVFYIYVNLPAGMDPGTYVFTLPEGITLAGDSSGDIYSGRYRIVSYEISGNVITFTANKGDYAIESGINIVFSLTRYAEQSAGSSGGGTSGESGGGEEEEEEVGTSWDISKTYTINPETMRYHFTIDAIIPAYNGSTYYNYYIEDNLEFDSSGIDVDYDPFGEEELTVTLRYVTGYYIYANDDSKDMLYCEYGELEKNTNDEDEVVSYTYENKEEGVTCIYDADDVTFAYKSLEIQRVYPDDEESGVVPIEDGDVGETENSDYAYYIDEDDGYLYLLCETDNGDEYAVIDGYTFTGWTQNWTFEQDSVVRVEYEDSSSHEYFTYYSGENYEEVEYEVYYENTVYLRYRGGTSGSYKGIRTRPEMHIPELISVDCFSDTGVYGTFEYKITINRGYTDSSGTYGIVDLSEYGAYYDEDQIIIEDTLENCAYIPGTLVIYYYPDNDTSQEAVYLTYGEDYELDWDYVYGTDSDYVYGTDSNDISNITGTQITIILNTSSLGAYTYYIDYDAEASGEIYTKQGSHSSTAILYLPGEYGSSGDGESSGESSEDGEDGESSGESSGDGESVSFGESDNGTTSGPSDGASGSYTPGGDDYGSFETLSFSLLKTGGTSAGLTSDSSESTTLEGLPGAVYEIYGANGEYITTLGTNESGYAVFVISRSSHAVIIPGYAYYMIETQAPEGYTLDTTPLWFYLSMSGTIQELEDAYEGITCIICSNADDSESGYTFTVVASDPAGDVLPETGAKFFESRAGTMLFGGLLITIATITYGLCIKRRKKVT